MTINGVSDARVLSTLKSTFGFSSFRPLQAEIVGSILQGRDVFVLMPTGGGKSLCYQLPALLLDGLTVVVSPLIALMKDQVDRLQALGVAATFINSSLDPVEMGRRQAAVARGQVKLLYVAPERLMMPGMLHLLGTAKTRLFAIDEAHCISEWGHDFRPDYRELSRLREVFPDATFSSFTATATRRVQADIRAQLGLQNAGGFCGSYNRANLYYDVRPKQKAYEQLVGYLREHRDESGIIYCQARAGTDKLAARLRGDGFNAAAYHAGLENDERRQRQEAFMRDDIRIVVATIAFGMGVDKPDIRFVVHFDLPKTLEGYYQESGRAGRDGEPSDCILFFTEGDAVKQRRFIWEKPSQKEREIALWQLEKMVDWAATRTCRRKSLLAYFEETLENPPPPRTGGRSARCCDVCCTATEEADFTIPAQKFLSCMLRTGERFGVAHVVAVLSGSKSARVLQLGHDKLSTYGIGRELSRAEWRNMCRELVRLGHVKASGDGFKVLSVTELGRQVLFKGVKVSLLLPVRPSAMSTADDEDHALFEKLRALRKRLADERHVPPYVVFSDATLKQMVEDLPSNRKELLRVHGVGEQKARDFGEAFLECIRAHVKETAPPPPPAAPLPTREVARVLTPAARATLRLFNEGRSIGDIAAERGVARSTVEKYLSDAAECGEDLDVARIVTPEKRQAIESAMGILGPFPLKPVMESLGTGYTYLELRVVRALLARAKPDA